MRPDAVRILGKDYRVQYQNQGVAPLDEDDLGDHDLPQQIITVRDNIHWQQQASATLHECLHAISDALGIGLTEQQVLSLETGLYSLLNENEKLVAYLISREE